MRSSSVHPFLRLDALTGTRPGACRDLLNFRLLQSTRPEYTSMVAFLAECIVPVDCINPRDYSTSTPPQVAWWLAIIITLAGFALAGALAYLRHRI